MAESQKEENEMVRWFHDKTSLILGLKSHPLFKKVKESSLI